MASAADNKGTTGQWSQEDRSVALDQQFQFILPIDAYDTTTVSFDSDQEAGVGGIQNTVPYSHSPLTEHRVCELRYPTHTESLTGLPAQGNIEAQVDGDLGLLSIETQGHQDQILGPSSTETQVDIDYNQRPLSVETPALEPVDEDLEVMGIANTWTDADPFPAALVQIDYPVPLPPPGGFDEMTCLESLIPVGPVGSEPGPFSSPIHDTLFSVDPEPLADVKDPNASSGVCGIRNLGNTCFMSSGLQCLASTPSLIQHFLNRAAGEMDIGDTLTYQFVIQLKKIWSGEFSVLHPTEFKQMLGFCHPQFKDYRQHDCQEFLALLLDTLHEQLNTAGCKSIVSDVTSVEPHTPHSHSEASADEKETVGITEGFGKYGTALTTEAFAQVLAASESSRSSHSSSPHSIDSHSSGEVRAGCPMKSIPEDIRPFKDLSLVAALRDSSSDRNFNEYVPEIDVIAVENVSAFSNQSLDLSKSNVIGIDEVVTSDLVKNELSQEVAMLDSNNIIVPQLLKKKTLDIHFDFDKLPEKNEMACSINLSNNLSPRIRGIEDFLKDAKTSNVNVLVGETEANNEIKFDSEKFSKHENIRLQNTLDNLNLTEYHNFDSKTPQRVKETNLLQDSKELLGSCSKFSDADSSECYSLNSIKRIRLDDKEKNIKMEFERKLRELEEAKSPREKPSGEKMGVAEVAVSSSVRDQSGGEAASSDLRDPVREKEELEADRHWEKYLTVNQSIIVDTFQGQFKSTVVCSCCRHVSVTYEPFMYLSVPLPRAMERQICVTYVPNSDHMRIKYLLTMNKQDKVKKLRQALCQVIGQMDLPDIILAEVLDNHIARILDENTILCYVNDTNRNIYAFALSPAPLAREDLVTCTQETEKETDPVKMDEASQITEHGGSPLDLTQTKVEAASTSAESGSSNVEERRTEAWKSCAICLEEMPDNDLRRHTSCSCLLCETCIQISCKHYGGESLICPVCALVVQPEDEFVPLDKLGDYKPKIRILNVPVVFRLDNLGDGDNNKKSMKLFGHPNIIRLPNRIDGRVFYEAVDKLVPYTAPYTVHLVDGQGYHCCRCMYTTHCRGCEISRKCEVFLQPGDNLAIRFTDLRHVNLEEASQTQDHKSMKECRKPEPLTLYDCLQAFSESETLDEHNPWYCPVCCQNQCATKTMTVWRYPDFLIIYLKRFVFHECSSTKLDNKVIFPVMGLDLMQYLSGPEHPGDREFNLFACVCHVGSAAAGHYTSYTRNPVTSEWHHFNDESVSRQKPQDEDYSNAYIIFYQRGGARYDVQLPPKFSFQEKLSDSLEKTSKSDSLKPNIDQLILDLDSSVEQDAKQDRKHSLDEQDD